MASQRLKTADYIHSIWVWVWRQKTDVSAWKTVRQKGSEFSRTQPFVLCREAFNWLDEAHPNWGGQLALLTLPYQMLIFFPRNILTDTPRIMYCVALWHPDKLIHKINCCHLGKLRQRVISTLTKVTQQAHSHRFEPRLFDLGTSSATMRHCLSMPWSRMYVWDISDGLCPQPYKGKSPSCRA